MLSAATIWIVSISTIMVDHRDVTAFGYVVASQEYGPYIYWPIRKEYWPRPDLYKVVINLVKKNSS